ncbi:MAG TPA: N-acetyl-gamma-glutamyl-phosphate reductase [Acidobacteriaceae bacterium]
MQQEVQTAVVGASGYAGMELARLLLAHPSLSTVPPLFLGREAGTLAAIHPRLQPLPGQPAPQIEPFSWDRLSDRGVQILFLATPHQQSRTWVPQALNRGMRVIDLSGAWRLSEPNNRAVYHFDDEGTPVAQATTARAVYGLSELQCARIARASLVANPGCYATSIILALKPLLAAGLLDLHHGIICDSKSGVSGAGREPTATTHFMHAADNLSAYGLFSHRHTGELLEQLSLEDPQIQFTPHLLPIPRGILSTIYVRLAQPGTAAGIEACYRDFYAGRPMVRLFPAGQLPQIAYVVRTGFCDLGFQLAPDGRRCVLVSCLDNLLKGAASQAVQNMNLMLGWDEAEGLL